MKSPNLAFRIDGLIILAIIICITLISPLFERNMAINDQPVLILVIMLVLSGAIYVHAIYQLRHLEWSRKLMMWIFCIGILMRFAMIASTPILEVDYNRYLWDGAVLANGLNPYKYSPQDVLNGLMGPDSLKYTALANESDRVPGRINHGYLRTIYPPITQAAFALAYLVKPWSLAAWRLILIFVDLITLGLILLLLRQLKLSPLLCMIYWWNPLLIKEIFNSGHMDILVFPLLAAGLLVVRRQPYWAMVFLGASVGVKFWPVTLLPLLLLGEVRSPIKMASCLILFCLAAGLALFPQLNSGIDPNSGLVAYSQRWQLNDGFFKLTVWASQFGLDIFGVHPGFKYRTARIVVGILFVGCVLVISFRHRRKSMDLFQGGLWIVAILFILIPTQFPWYFIWLVPFLTVRPRVPLLIFTILLPLYYLRYYLEGLGAVEIFDYGVVWLEHVPVWILLIREWFMNHSKNQDPFREIVAVHEV